MRFWRYVIHTVADVTQRDVSETLLPLFNLQPQLPLELLVDTFLNELDTIPRTVQIVMDDYHLIDNDTIHEMMTRFIDYLPNNVHVYMTSRAELPLPITKWRVKSWLSEIGKEQLRFTYEDIKRFYEKKNLDYKDSDSLRYVLDRTEGWAAGIQLIGLTIDMSKQNNRIVDPSHTTHPFITEFLLNEILATLPLDVQDFLVRTSLLHLLDPAICNTLTNRSDSDAILLELEKKGYSSSVYIRASLFFAIIICLWMPCKLNCEIAIQRTRLPYSIKKQPRCCTIQGTCIRQLSLRLQMVSMK